MNLNNSNNEQKSVCCLSAMASRPRQPVAKGGLWATSKQQNVSKETTELLKGLLVLFLCVIIQYFLNCGRSYGSQTCQEARWTFSSSLYRVGLATVPIFLCLSFLLFLPYIAYFEKTVVKFLISIFVFVIYTMFLIKYISQRILLSADMCILMHLHSSYDGGVKVDKFPEKTITRQYER